MHRSGAEDLAIPDFDGTRAPVLADPTEEWLDTSTWYVLARLSRTSDIVLKFISGRAINDFRMHVCVPDIIYAGNHHVPSELGMITFEQPSYTRRFGLIQKLD